MNSRIQHSSIVCREKLVLQSRICTKTSKQLFFSPFVNFILVRSINNENICAELQYLYMYYYMRNFFNLIGLEQWYFSLIWNTYHWKL